MSTLFDEAIRSAASRVIAAAADAGLRVATVETVTGGLLAKAQYDAVHLNSQFSGDRPTDHDPQLALFDFGAKPSADAEAVAQVETVQAFDDATHDLGFAHHGGWGFMPTLADGMHLA